MPTVDNHIASLLQEHDCVIIPGFGGLITQYNPVRIHPVKSSMSPPSKKVAFNEKLQQNDGRLINQISVQEQLSETDAITRVQAFVTTVNLALNQHQKYLLQDIGLFRKDKEGAIEFDYEARINLLAESFGLPEVFSKPVVRTRSLSEIRTAVQEKVAIPLQAELEGQKNTSIWKKTLRYAALLPIMMLSASAIYLATTLDNGLTLSNLNPVSLIMNLKPEIPNSVTDILKPATEKESVLSAEPVATEAEQVSLIPEENASETETLQPEKITLTPITEEERGRLFSALMPAKTEPAAYLTDQFLSQEVSAPTAVAENSASQETGFTSDWDTPAEAISAPAEAEPIKETTVAKATKSGSVHTAATGAADIFVESKSGKFYIIVGGFASV
ncbi:MAG: hypothetical protein EOP49_43335, partial [Sphingobacteriales bacterium]